MCCLQLNTSIGSPSIQLAPMEGSPTMKDPAMDTVILLPWKDLQPAATSDSDPCTSDRIHSAMAYDGSPTLSSLDNGSVTTADAGLQPSDLTFSAFYPLDCSLLLDEELPFVVNQNSAAINDSHDVESKVDYVPLRIVRPEGTEIQGKNRPDVRYKPTAQKTTTFKKKRGFPTCFKVAKSDKDDTFVSTRKRGRPAGSKPAKRKMEQKMAWKPALVDDIHNSDLRDDTETKRKRGGPAGSKPAKRRMEQKMAQKPAIVDDIQHSNLTKVKLPGEYHSFTKRMLKSHVVQGFYLGLPGSFCTAHLPKENSTITLEDEHGESYDTNYLHDRKALSGGWGEFARKHSIRVGDDVVFQLDGTKKFKVHILRNGPPGLDTSKKNNIWNEAEGSEHGVNSKDHLEVTAGDNSSTSSMMATTLFAREGGVCIDKHDVRSPYPGLGDVENFQVILHGSIINLPDGLRRRYYELCCSQKAVLHRNLLETNDILAEGMITETSHMAECVMTPFMLLLLLLLARFSWCGRRRWGHWRFLEWTWPSCADASMTFSPSTLPGHRRFEFTAAAGGDSKECCGGNGCGDGRVWMRGMPKHGN
ncbi:B3 domain-containing protein Os01g0234100-like [Triticum aestivum]|uniref:B3 domain-containing protein Os01g0234100-like n=1 Tax=Triticum aestivum TaxID=4565 RepID=UPI001D016A7F|nr:B3 domain-containing protein Os01g0234100-like [Triticum aestivum]